MKSIRSITRQYVDDLINFAPTEEIRAAGIGELQRDGCVASFNMLVRNGVAYLADEVGMGKTYIGLSIMSLLRYQKPDARVLIITPRRNIQDKWASDLLNFVRYNWKRPDHRVKTPQGSPDFPVRTPERLANWLNDLYDQEIGAHDTILRMSSFSLSLGAESMDTLLHFKNCLDECLKGNFSHLKSSASIEQFAQAFKEALRPHPYDLIIVDEAHNLKYGYTPGVPSSIRNEMMYNLFGRRTESEKTPWLLMLSATPMENGDPLSLVRQFEVFDRTSNRLDAAPGQKGPDVSLSTLAEESEDQGIAFKKLRDHQKRLIVRRVGELRLSDQSVLTRNMYRCEWRAGGVESPEKELERPGSAVRLVNAVLQKNVFEMLQGTRGGKFRIGALESFEIYSGQTSQITDLNGNPQKGPDTAPDQHIIARLCSSFRRTFEEEVPHPKLNAVTGFLQQYLQRREKALTFVRRVATTWDLATRVSRAFDDDLSARLKAEVLKSDLPRVHQLIRTWEEMRSKRQFQDPITTGSTADTDEDAHTPWVDGEDEAEAEAGSREEEATIKEAVPTLFSWFFKGEQQGMEGFKDIYGGRRLREQLELKSQLCLLLEENYVDWFLGRPFSILQSLAERSGKPREQILNEIGCLLPVSMDERGNYRRQYHAVQFAALQWMLAQQDSASNKIIQLLMDVLYPVSGKRPESDKKADPELLSQLLETKGLYPWLARIPANNRLRSVVAGGEFEDIRDCTDKDFRLSLQRREQVRLMQMALLRHGAPVVDLYFVALKVRGGRFSFANRENPPDIESVAKGLVNLWQLHAENPDAWRASAGWELAEVNAQFELIKKLNFPNLDQYDDEDRPLDLVFKPGIESPSDSQGIRSARRLLNQELSGQAPVAAAQGSQSDERRRRLTSQFRMPGMPWILVATSVYEEGVDLHTYCRTVIHHGISHSATAIEQRTGRIDRIGGLVQRDAAKLTGVEGFSDELKIQSLFPYQSETFEKHQVRRVLHNCNRFLESLHETDDPITEHRETSLEDRREKIPPQITTRLKSPFDVCESPWLDGELKQPDRRSDFDENQFFETVQAFETRLNSTIDGVRIPTGQGLDRRYQIGETYLHLTPHSHREGDQMLLVMRLEMNGFPLSKNTLECDSLGVGWVEEAMRTVLEMLFPLNSLGQLSS